MAVVSYVDGAGNKDRPAGPEVDRSPASRIVAQPDIPVRRYGTVPPPPEQESIWDVEPDHAPAHRTIADYGGLAVLAAALGAALVAGCLLYLR